MAPGLPEMSLVREAAKSLDDPFLVVVVGEFNAGKSSVINALLGGKCVPAPGGGGRRGVGRGRARAKLEFDFVRRGRTSAPRPQAKSKPMGLGENGSYPSDSPSGASETLV